MIKQIYENIHKEPFSSEKPGFVVNSYTCAQVLICFT